MAERLPAAAASSLAATSVVCGPGLPDPGRSFRRSRSRDQKGSRSRQCQRRIGDGGPAAQLGPKADRPHAGHPAGSGMEPAIASCDGGGRWLCLERPDLRQPDQDRPRHHRHPMERSPLFWTEGQAGKVNVQGRAMKAALVKPVRCAIYTRVSTDQGLDQEFNSLDAQYDASSAYIRSQAHAGWVLIKARYDDGGYSGGSTDRPDLQRLLDDIRARKIDVIVVYKVDRLTRSLADFAKLVELFDAHGVSFVSVTQQFNTTTSMGRLTLNVLLSFAQFEREVTSERIRDKIAASKRKGLWVGGPLPLGYDMKDGKVGVLENEAEQVRLIFRRYLELSGVNALVRDLKERNIRTKTKLLANGGTRGGIPFERGTLFYLLRNRFYISEVRYKGEILPGEQPPIIYRALFDAIQQKLTDQRI